MPREGSPLLSDLGLFGYCVGLNAIAFYLLNTFWMSKLIMGAIKLFKPKKPSNQKKQM